MKQEVWLLLASYPGSSYSAGKEPGYEASYCHTAPMVLEIRTNVRVYWYCSNTVKYLLSAHDVLSAHPFFEQKLCRRVFLYLVTAHPLSEALLQ